MPAQTHVRCVPGVSPGATMIDFDSGNVLAEHDLRTEPHQTTPGWFHVVYTHTYDGQEVEHLFTFETSQDGVCRIILPQHPSLTYVPPVAP